MITLGFIITIGLPLAVLILVVTLPGHRDMPRATRGLRRRTTALTVSFPSTYQTRRVLSRRHIRASRRLGLSGNRLGHRVTAGRTGQLFAVPAADLAGLVALFRRKHLVFQRNRAGVAYVFIFGRP